MVRKYPIKDRSTGKIVGYITRDQVNKNTEKISKARSRNKKIQEQKEKELRKKEGLPTIKKGTFSGKTYTITEKKSLTNEQIIQQNKKFLQEIEQKKELAKKQGNKQLEQKLTRQYNDIARVTNQKIKQENLNIEKAKIVSEFANLYPDQKAQKIVKESGYKKYLSVVEKKPNYIEPEKTKSSEPEYYSNRWVFDSKSNTWLDTKNTGSGAELRSINYINPNMPNSYPEKTNFFQKIGSNIQQVNRKYIESQYQSKNSYTPFQKIGFFSTSLLTGGFKGVKDFITQPQEVLAGSVMTIINPASSYDSLKIQIKKNPAETIGYIGSQSIIFNFAVKGIKKGGVYIQNKNLAKVPYDYNYRFIPDDSLLYDQTQLYPKTRSKIIGDVRSSSSTSSLKYNYDVSLQPTTIKNYYSGGQTRLRNVKTTSSGFPEFTIVDKAGVSQTYRILSLESGTSIQPTLSYNQRFKIVESTLKNQKSIPLQTKLPKPTVKPKPFVEVKSNFETALTNSKTVRFGVAASVGELSYVVLKDIKSSITRSQIFKGYSTPNILKSSQGSGFNVPLLVINTNMFDSKQQNEPSKVDTGFKIEEIAKDKQETPLKQKPQDKSLFKPIEKYDLYNGFNVKSFSENKINSDNKQNQEIFQIQGQDQGQDQEQDQIQTPKTKPIKKVSFNQKSSNKNFDFTTQKIIQPKPTTTIKTNLENSKFKTGFNVLVRRKGKFTKVSDTPLNFEDAKGFGSSIVGKTAAATFKLEQTRTLKLGSFTGSGNLRDFYRKGSLFIEKKSKRIKSVGEKEEITFKGLAALRFKNKKLWGFN